MVHGGLRCKHLGLGECSGQGVEAEVVIRVAVADVDGGQLFAAGSNLFHDLFGLGFAELRVHQDRVFFAADEYGRHRENRFFSRVVDIQRQRRCTGVGGKAEGGAGQ
ncbi:hypothetical protein D3C84_780350 [compost metagenome]